MRKITLFLLLCILVVATGCPRYDAVRRLSTEQLAVQQSLKTNIIDYYKAMDKLLTQQAQAASVLIDAETKEQIEARNQQLSLELASATNRNDRYQMAKAASADVEKFSRDAATKKQLISERVSLIKAKHNEIIQAYQTMYEAQTELDRYIQLKKVDEVIAESLTNKFKISQEKLNSATVVATNATSELFDILRR